MAEQTIPPERIIVSGVRPEDYEGVEAGAIPIDRVARAKGLCAQRNVILEMAQDADLVVFFDDDFIPGRAYLEKYTAFFAREPGAAIATGRVLSDGILGPGIPFEEALRTVRAADAAPEAPVADEEVEGGYGCNFGVRMSVARAHGLRFDEALPLYGWLEDLDFSRRAARHGGVWRVGDAVGSHMGVKVGRTPGVKLGYSQVANPLYMWRQGSVSFRRSMSLIARRFFANHVKPLYVKEEYVDRGGRARGNWLAVKDALTGRVDPRRILEL